MLTQYDVEQIVRRMLASTYASVSAQQDGTVVSDGHRSFNFRGSGVTVTEDAAMRRTNVLISGAPNAVTAVVAVLSSTAAKMLSLWNGSGNNAPPANWQTAGFSDAAWANAVVATTAGGSAAISGASPIWLTSTLAHASEQQLSRQTFSLAAGTITSATLEITCDEFTVLHDGVWVNGTFIGDQTAGRTAVQTLSVPPSVLLPGATNLIACHVDGGTLTNANLTYRLTVNYGSAAVDTRYQLLSEKAAANGYASLDSSGKVPTSELPLASGTIVVQEIDGTPSVVANTLEVPNGTLTDLGSGVAQFVPGYAGGGLTSSMAQLGADVTMTNANQYYDGPSLSLGAGTWLLVGQVVTTDTTGTSTTTAKLWDGTTPIASAESGILSASMVTLPLSGLVTLTGTTTIKISVANTSAGRKILAAASFNAAGNTASTLSAVRIA